MGKTKKKKKRQTWSSKKNIQSNKKPLKSKSMKLIGIVISSGLFVFILSLVVSHSSSKTDVEFSKPLNNGYEFEITNDSNVDFKIKSLRIDLPKQQFVFEIDKDVYATITEDGVVLPYGNVFQVPAAEYKGLDGKLVKAKSSFPFRIPPLSNRNYLKAQAVIVNVIFTIEAKNSFIKYLDSVFLGLNMITRDFKQTYLVVNNFWNPTNHADVNSALIAACRDDIQLEKSAICEGIYP